MGGECRAIAVLNFVTFKMKSSNTHGITFQKSKNTKRDTLKGLDPPLLHLLSHLSHSTYFFHHVY